MTTPQPYSHDFAVPTQAVTAATITENMLPPVPRRPLAVTVGVVLLGLCGLANLVGGVWHAIATLDSGASSPGPSQLVLWMVYPLLTFAAIAVLGRLAWLGSPVAVILCILGTCYAMVRLLAIAYRLIEGLAREESASLVAELYLRDPHAIGLSVASVLALPLLVLFALPASRRWNRKAGMIRQIRRLIRKGRPVTRLPAEIFE